MHDNENATSVYEQNQCSQHLLPWGASLNPCTNWVEFSLKNRWRYMMRTSAWQLRFKMSTESAIRRESPSAASRPRWSSASREKSWRSWERPGNHKQSWLERVHNYIMIWESDCVLTLSVNAEDRGWYRRSRALAIWRQQRCCFWCFLLYTHTHTSSSTGLPCGNIVKLKLQTSQVTVTHTFFGELVSISYQPRFQQ